MHKQYDYYENYQLTANFKVDDAQYPDKDIALVPGTIIVNPTDPVFDDTLQLQRTVTGMARTPGGRLFLSYYSGGAHADEDVGNYVMVISSDDDGKTFQNRIAVAPPNWETSRTFDANLWVDDTGRLWLFWCQSYLKLDGRIGVWASRCDNPDDEEMHFTEPRRFANGLLLTQPIITRDGLWLIPTALADDKCWHGSANGLPKANWLPKEQGVSVYASKDRGETFERIASGIRFPFSTFDEPCIVERSDGSLWMWIRGMNCMGDCFSYDGGYTWTIPCQNPKLNFPNTHSHIGRLKSGRLLALVNYKADMFSFFGGRNNLTALISSDDGATWESALMIDEREGSEQPDFVEGDNGFIYISYGRAPQIAGESMLAVVTEEDILAGKLVNPASRLRIVAGKAAGIALRPDYEDFRRLAEKHNI